MDKIIPYGRQFIDENDITEVVKVLKSDFLTQGPKVAEFEQKFAQYIGAKYAVAVANGTAALHLSNLALGTKQGDKVITTPITFAASANSVLFCGGQVDFVDIDPKTFTIDLNKLEHKLATAPKGTYKGIIPVDFAGYPVDIQEIRQIADKYNLWIIEDACHAPGAFFIDDKGNKQLCGNGNFADLQIFSFHPVKHIATGEGGMITTNNKELYEKLLLFRTHGITKDANRLTENHGNWYYEMHELGFNYRLSDIHASLGITQLQKLNKSLQLRNKIAENYNNAFAKLKALSTPFVAENIFHAYHLYVVQVEQRKQLYDYLRRNKIFAQVHYIPVHLQPYYKQFGWKKGDFPVAENFYEKALSLPMFPSLTDEEQNFVIKKVIEFYFDI